MNFLLSLVLTVATHNPYITRHACAYSFSVSASSQHRSAAPLCISSVAVPAFIAHCH
jgi:hypothetical protein